MQCCIYLKRVEDSEQPCKCCGVVVDCEDTKHPGETKEGEENQCSKEQGPAVDSVATELINFNRETWSCHQRLRDTLIYFQSSHHGGNAHTLLG